MYLSVDLKEADDSLRSLAKEQSATHDSSITGSLELSCTMSIVMVTKVLVTWLELTLGLGT